MRTTSPRHWAIHPQPDPLESLSSWLERLAAPYEIPVGQLLSGNLGLPGLMVPADLDYAPPQAMLAALAHRTGLQLAQLRAMTVAGWEPWLFDTLDVPIDAMQPMFEAYVRASSVLLAPGEAGVHQVLTHRGRWAGPWRPLWLRSAACPVCASEPGRGRALVWRFALTTGCTWHGCRLQDAATVALVKAGIKAPEPVPVAEPAAAVDGYTHQALTTGRVSLPGREVHAAVWFRLLRSLLDELSLSPSGLTSIGRATLRRVWQEAGIEERAGVNVWQPYEHLDAEIQEKLRHAAGAALRLLARGDIRGRGRLAAAVQPPLAPSVYDGDPPAPQQRSAWDDARESMEAVLALARTDRDTARQLLALLTRYSRTLAQYEQERAVLFSAGIPAEFLPSARELGRGDLA